MLCNPTHLLKAAEFDYTYLGRSEAEISKLYNIPLPSIMAEIQSGNWQRKLEPACLPSTSDLAKFTETLKDITEQRLTIISLFRQIDNQPLYAQIEKALLAKILAFTESLHTLDDKASVKIANLTKALIMIQERNPLQLATSLEEAGKGKAFSVYIQNNIDGNKTETRIQ